MTAAAARVPCCVPGCRRSFRPETCRPGVQYVCSRCFSLADTRARDRYRQLKRRGRKLSRLTNRQSIANLFEQAHARGRIRCVSYHTHDRRMRAAMARVWERIVSDAEIKLAMGADGAPRRRRA